MAIDYRKLTIAAVRCFIDSEGWRHAEFTICDLNHAMLTPEEMTAMLACVREAARLEDYDTSDADAEDAIHEAS